MDFLRTVGADESYPVTGKAVVVGGGNVAIDVARTAQRCGAESVAMFCLEPRDKMPASEEEIAEALEEDVTIDCSWGPKEILTENGRVTGIVFKRCVSVWDKDGKFAPAYDENDTKTVPCDRVFLSIGQSILWGDLLKGSKVELGRGNGAVADSLTYQTAEPDIFVGGDVYTGPKFAIDAIAAGREGAISIHRFVQPHSSLTIGRNRREFIALDKDNIKVEQYDNASRQIPGTRKDVDHKKSFRDAKLPFTEEQVKAETARCLGCGASVVDPNKCIGCGVCTTKKNVQRRWPMRTDKIRKYLIPNIPYLFILWAFLKLGTAYRLAAGNDFAHKLIGLGQTIGPAFADFAPGLAPLDWLVGIVGAVGFRLLIYFKSKNAKKFRRDAEYGSARWGTEKDIKPFVDPKFENNVILTGTEFLTMNTRPKIPANARNLNCCIIGSSGSGKTRFWLTPQLLQAHSSYVVVDPKGGVLGQVGAFLQKRGYKIKVFNSIDFSKSMHYNPLAYIRNEADILKFVDALISNTKGEGKEGDPFWTKSETLLYCALIAYIIFEGPAEDRNMNTLGGIVRITWNRTPAMFQIFISDNGSGIAPEDIHHIFKRFYRSKHSIDTQGIGLGLPLAKSIIEGQGGVISVQSESGKGTLFTLSFLTEL